jgi:hypothetical protein
VACGRPSTVRVDGHAFWQVGVIDGDRCAHPAQP